MLKPYRFIGRETTYAGEFYRTGRVYMLLVVIEKDNKVTIESPYQCPYDSLELFKKNWVRIKDSEIL